jgi:NitT/TauT family transport system ATP-binding protein
MNPARGAYRDEPVERQQLRQTLTDFAVAKGRAAPESAMLAADARKAIAGNAGALDPGIRADIHVLMRKLWNDRALTIVMVTHDLSEAFRLATRVIAFDRRRNEPSDGGRYGATITRDLEIWPKREPTALDAFKSGRDDPQPLSDELRDDPAKTGMAP